MSEGLALDQESQVYQEFQAQQVGNFDQSSRVLSDAEIYVIFSSSYLKKLKGLS